MVTAAQVDAFVNRENVSNDDLSNIISTAENQFEDDASTTFDDSNKTHHLAVLYLSCHFVLEKENADYIEKDVNLSRKKTDKSTEFLNKYTKQVLRLKSGSAVLE